MKNIFTLIVFLFHFSTQSQVSDFKHVDFSIANNIAKLHEGEDLKNLPLLSYKLTSKLPTDVEKFRAIYIWVCNNINGDYKQHSKISRKRKSLKKDSLNLTKWNNNYKKKAFKILLKRKKTMCTGYAYLIKELCFLANIESKIIDGYGRTVDANINALETPNHSWNAVKLNNKWYLCDATWSSGYMNENTTFIKEYNDGYFLTSPELFAKNHFPVEKKWLLNKNVSAFNFTESPLVYGEIFKHKIIPITPSVMKFETSINNEVEFKFKLLTKIIPKKISLVQFKNSNEKLIEINNISTKQGVLKFKSKFKIKGAYDVHLKIDNDIIATYTVKSKKH